LSSIRFNASAGQPVKPEVLNHKTASPFQKNNIQFHIGSSYLKDFTDAGIERFLEKQPGVNKLDKAEVKAFIQRLAQNPEAVAGMTFDLADPQIGLAKNDNIELRHLNGAFTLNLVDQKHLPEGSSSQNVKFVDVTSVSFDVFEQEKAIKQAEQNLKTLEGQLEQVKKSHGEVKDERSTAEGRIGDKPQTQLTEARAKLKESEEQLASLETDLKGYKADLESLKANKDMPAADKAKQRTLLERAIRGAESEKTRFQTQKKETEAELKEKHGSFLVTNYSLEDLEKLNTKVSNSEARVQNVQQQVDKARAELAALRKGEKPAASTEPATEAPATPAETETPTTTTPATATAPSEADFAKMDTNQKTLALADMSPADQQKFVALLSSEEKTQVTRRANYHLENLKQTGTLPTGSESKLTKEAQIAKFEQLLQQLQAPTTTPAKPTEEVKPADGEKPADSPTGSSDPAPTTPPVTGNTPAAPTIPTTPTTPAAPTAPTTPAAPPAIVPGEGISVGTGDANTPPDALLSEGKPLTFNGQVLTLSNFSQLAIHQQFDILMKVDEAQLKATLKLIKKEDRAQIRSLAGAVVSNYAAQQSQSINNVISSGGGTGTAGSGGISFQGINLSSYMNSASVQRAQRIIQLLDEIEMEERGQSVPTTGPTQPTGPAGNGDRYTYTVRPGDTPLSIAEREYGDKFRVHEVYQLNPGLDAAMQQRGVSNRHTEKLDGYQNYKELILSRTPLPLDPVTTTPARTPAPTNPVVEVEAPVAVAPVAPAPAKPVEEPAPVKVEAPVSAPVVTPAPKEEAPTAKLEEEEAPVAPAPVVTAPKPEPKQEPEPVVAAEPTPAPVVAPPADKPAPKRPTS
jgi:hypothetical protein